MKKLTVIGAILVGAAILSVSPVSLNWSANQGVSVSQDKAYAVIGRPGTPGSVAGVARRQTRPRCTAWVRLLIAAFLRRPVVAMSYVAD